MSSSSSSSSSKLWNSSEVESLTNDDDGRHHGITMNWMKTARVDCAVWVRATTVGQVQAIVQDSATYPSPVRPAGRILSPSAVCHNPGGTTVQMIGMNQIHGMVRVPVPNSREMVSCIDTDCGVSLRELQLYAHAQNLELPFSAEIGSSTIGGTCFAVTKDSSIGKPALPGMGLGDVASSMLWSVQVVEENGALNEYSLFDPDGNCSAYFQSLLDSYGTRGIAVRMKVVARPQTPVVTTVYFFPVSTNRHGRLAERLYRMYKSAHACGGGNVFCGIGTRSGVAIAEERLPVAAVAAEAAPNRTKLVAPLSSILAPLYGRLLRYLIQRCQIPWWFHLLRPLSGSCWLRFITNSRRPGNDYDPNVPAHKPKLAFSYYSFPIDNFVGIVTAGLDFTRDYQQQHGYTPVGFAIYFVTHSGKRVAGPYKGQEECSFNLDPITNAPNCAEWKKYVVEFNKFAKAHGGRPSLNQTLCLEHDVEFGASAVAAPLDPPSPRFTSPWLQQFYDAARDKHACD